MAGHAKPCEDLIVSDPDVMMGKPSIVGTRITVEYILEALAAGETPEEIVGEHPRLTLEAIRAALAYAADVLKNDEVLPLKTRLA